MKITKYGHACLLVEEGEARVLIDPGKWNPLPDAENVDVVLITHEHQDHVDVEQLKAIMATNPEACVVTHEGVGEAVLNPANIAYAPIEEGGRIDIKGVPIESFGHDHAPLYGDVSPCRNTGYLIGEKLFVPGDALHDVPGKTVEFLALPTGGPWMKLAEAVDYVKQVKPKVAFPIHDAVYIEEYQRGLVPSFMSNNLKDSGIEFRDLPAGKSIDL